jgi:PAS domain S-box-containing protein
MLLSASNLPIPRRELLVVSHDAEVAGIFAGVAARCGLVARTAPPEQQAIATTAGELAVAVLDLDSPDVDALALCRELSRRDEDETLPVLLWTGSPLNGNAGQYLEAGATDLLRKPLSEEEIEFRVQAHLHRTKWFRERRRLHERLMLVGRTAQDAIVMVDNEGRVTYWNEAAERLFGYSSEEIMGQEMHVLLAPERYRQFYIRGFEQFRAGGMRDTSGSTRELYALRRTGEEFLMELSLTAAEFDGKWCALGIARDITERRRMEESLRESEERFRKVFEEGSLGIALIGLDLSYRQVNGALCRMLGYTESELNSMSVLETTCSADVEATKKRFATLLRGETPSYQIRKRYVAKDGGTIWGNASVTLIRDSQGVPTHCLSIVENITDRMRDELKMFNLVTAINHTAEMVVITGPDGVVRYTNPAFENFTGYTLDDVCGMGANVLASPHYDPLQYRDLWFTICGGWNWSRQFTNKKKNGEVYEEEATISPIRDERGEISGFVTIKRDVTDRVRLEAESRKMNQKLQESENRLTRILESVPVGIALVGVDYRIRWANRMAMDLVGARTPEEFIGHSCDQVMCGACERGCPFGEIGGASASGETTIMRRDGTYLPVFKRVQTINFEHEKLRLESFIDLTERRHLEAELGQARKLEAVGQLASGVAHEVNTPIQYVGDGIRFLKDGTESMLKLLPLYRRVAAASAGGAAEPRDLEEIRWLEEDIDLEWLLPEIPTSFDRCLEGVERVARIVRALKEFAHHDERAKSPADLNHSLETTLTIARNEYKYVADVETSWGEIPPVVCLVSELNQVFLNLILNAAQAIEDVVKNSGGRGKIRISTKLEGGCVRIDVEDSGGGIPPAIQDRIFEPFFTTKEVGKGSGQGLAIARSVVVDKHGGSLTFQSQKGWGTTFTVLLPISGSPHQTMEQMH